MHHKTFNSPIVLLLFFILFATSLILIRPTFAAKPEIGLQHKWRLNQQNTQGNLLFPKVGSIRAKISKHVKIDNQNPASFHFNGKNSSLRLLIDAKDNPLPKKQITIEAWLRVEELTAWGGIVGVIKDVGNYEKGWLLGYKENQFFFALATKGADDGNGRLTYLYSKTTFQPSNWYHLVATYDGKHQRLYVDGRLANESTVQSGEILYPKKIESIYTIGAFYGKNKIYSFSGNIGEVSIFDRARSKVEIAMDFQLHKLLLPDLEPAKPVITDWPTYLHDNNRSGVTPEQLQLPLSAIWVHHASHAPAPAWPQPAQQDFWHQKFNLKPRVIYDRAYHVVAVAQRAYYATSADDQLVCINLKTGKTLWTFFAEGPIRLAPTVDGGRLYFGSDDGHVYCLDAIRGNLIWKYFAAPYDRRIAGNQRIISMFPVRSGVLIENGLVRFTSGLFPNEGTYQFVLDAKTGKELATAKISVSTQGYMQRRGNKLYVATGRSPKAFVASLKRRGKQTGAYLGQMVSKYPYAFIGAGNLRFAGGDGEIAAFRATDGELLWQAKVDGKAYSLAVANGCLLVGTDRGKIYCFRYQNNPLVLLQDDTKAQVIRSSTSDPIYPNQKLQQFYELAATQILNHAQIQKGYCLVVDSDEGYLAYELARRSKLTIIAIEADLKKVQRSRKRLSQAGLYGRVVVHQLKQKKKLPYSDMLMNLVVSDKALLAGKLPENLQELVRVLAPSRSRLIIGSPNDFLGFLITEEKTNKAWGNFARIQWKEITGDGHWLVMQRNPPENIGQWSHMYANPANTVCSGDDYVSGKLRLQWFGRPGPRKMIDRHHRNVPPLSKNGRLFISGDNIVIAADIYNGTSLWQTKVPNSRRVAALRDSGNMVATDDRVYIVTGDSCKVLDVSDGKIIDSIVVPQAMDHKKREWGYLSVVDAMLIGTAVKPGASRTELSKKAIIEGSYWDHRRIVTSDYLFVLDPQDHKILWRYDARQGAIVNPTITIAEGTIYFVESAESDTLKTVNGRNLPKDLWKQGSHLVSLDLKTGKERWRVPGNFRNVDHHLFVSCSQEKIIVVGSRNQAGDQRDQKGNPISHVWYEIHVIDAKNGQTVWFQSYNSMSKSGGDHGEQDKHQVIVGDVVYLEPFAFDLHSGKRLEKWRLTRGGHGCGAISASSDSFFFRAANPAICDLATGRIDPITKISRPGCWINMLPVGGMLLIPEASSGCSCNFSLQTSMGFIPEKLLYRENQKVKQKPPMK